MSCNIHSVTVNFKSQNLILYKSAIKLFSPIKMKHFIAKTVDKTFF